MTAQVDDGQLLTFLLAGDEYAVGLLSVDEVVTCGPITRVPAMPVFIPGAMNLRGRAIPVIDLARKLGFPITAITRWSCLLIMQVDIQSQPTALGVLVDAVGRLIECTSNDIQPPPSVGTRVHPEYLRGLVSTENGFVPLLDLQRLLSTEELLSVTSAKAQPQLPRSSASPDCEKTPE